MQVTDVNELLQLIQLNEVTNIAYVGPLLSITDTEQLISELKSNTVLTDLGLNHHSIDEKTANEISRLLTRNCNIRDFYKTLQASASKSTNNLAEFNLQPYLELIQQLLTISPTVTSSLQHTLLANVRQLLSSKLAELLGLQYDLEKSILNNKQFFLLQCLLVIKAVSGSPDEVIPVIAPANLDLHTFLDENADDILENLQKCTLTGNEPEWLKQLTQSLQKKYSTLLTLKHNLLNNKKVSFCNIVDEQYYTTTIDRNILETLIDGLNVNELDLSSITPNRNDLAVILQAIAGNQTIELLNLGYDGIDSGKVQAIADMLSQNVTLKMLCLDCDNIGDNGAKTLADGLIKNKTLTSLNLCANGIGPSGTKAITVALAKNTTLDTLYLSYNEIGPDGAKLIAEVLAQNTTLTTLYLDANNIGQVGAKYLVKALETNTTLTKLGFDNNDINAKLTIEINTLLTRNRRIRDFNETLDKILYKQPDQIIQIDLQSHIDFIHELVTTEVSPRVVSGLQLALLSCIPPVLLSHFISKTTEASQPIFLVSNSTQLNEVLSLSEALQSYILPCLLISKNDQVYWPRLQEHEQASETILAAVVGLKYDHGRATLTNKQFFLLQCLLVTKAVTGTSEEPVFVITSASQDLHKYLDENADDILENLQNCTLTDNEPEWLKQLVQSFQKKYSTLQTLQHKLLFHEYVSLRATVDKQFYTGTFDQNILETLIDGLKIDMLELGGIRPTPGDLTTILHAIADNKTLAALYLSANNINNTTVIAEALTRNTKLLILDLFYNDITCDGIKPITDVLAQNKTLITSICLNGNKLGDVGAKAIAEALIQNKILTSIRLGNNEIGPEGAIALADALTQNKTLISIDLSANEIDDAGAKAIMQALEKNITLVDLDLTSNKIDGEILDKIRSLLARNRFIRDFNKISDAAMAECDKDIIIKTQLYSYLNIIRGFKKEAAPIEVIGKLQYEFLISIFILMSSDKLEMRDALEYMLPYLLDCQNNKVSWICLPEYELSSETIAAKALGLHYNPAETTLTAKQKLLLQCLLVVKAIAKSFTGKIPVITPDNSDLCVYLDANADIISMDLKACILVENIPDWLREIIKLLQEKLATILALEHFLLNCEEIDLRKVMGKQHLIGSIDEVILEVLSDGLKQTEKLKKIDLSYVKPNSDDSFILAEAISANKTLENLTCNNIGGYGVKAVVSALMRNTTLKRLNLLNNNITDNEIEFIAKALKNNTTLTVINLSLNNIDNNGARFVIQMLETNTTLMAIFLPYNKVDKETEDKINKLLARNRHVNDFNKNMQALASEHSNELVRKTYLQSCLNNIQTLKSANADTKIIGKLQHDFLVAILGLTSTNSLCLAIALRKYVLPCLLNNDKNDIDLSCLQEYEQSPCAVLAELFGLRRELEKPLLTSKQKFLLQCLLVSKAVNQVADEITSTSTSDNLKLSTYLDKNADKIIRDLQDCVSTEYELDWLKKLIQSLLKKNSILLTLQQRLQNDEKVQLNDIIDKQYCRGEIDEVLLTAVVDGLKQTEKLKELRLNGLNLNYDNLFVILLAIIDNTTLNTIDLSLNDIDLAKARLIAAALVQNKRIDTLILNSCNINNVATEIIVTPSIQNKTLKTLSLAGNKIDNAGAEIIKKVLESNTTLTELIMPINAISVEMLDHIYNLLVRNRHIRDFNKALHIATFGNVDELTINTNLAACLDALLILEKENYSLEIVGKLQNRFLIKVIKLKSNAKIGISDALNYILPYLFDVQNRLLSWSRLSEIGLLPEAVAAEVIGLHYNPTEMELTHKQTFLLQCLLVTHAIAGKAAEITLYYPDLCAYLDANADNILECLKNCVLTESEPEWLKQLIIPMQRKCSAMLTLKNCLLNDEKARLVTVGNDDSIDKDIIEVLVDGLKQTKKLKKLDLSDFKSSHHDLLTILQAIVVNKTINSLDLTHAKIEAAEMVQVIADILTQNMLSTLYLANNKIGNVGAEIIAKAMTQNTKLKKLYLSSNDIDDKGGVAIANALLQNTTLESLSLRNNKIADIGAKAFAALLAQNNTLTTLDLNLNGISNEGGKVIDKTLKTNICLKDVSMSGNLVEDKMLNEIERLITRNRLIRNFNWHLYVVISDMRISLRFHLGFCLDRLESLKSDETVSLELISKLQQDFLTTILRLALNDRLTMNAALQKYVIPCLLITKNNNITWPRSQGYGKPSEIILSIFVGLNYNIDVDITDEQFWLLQCFILSNVFSNSNKKPFQSSDKNKVPNILDFLNANAKCIIKDLNFQLENRKNTTDTQLTQYIALAQHLLSQTPPALRKYTQQLPSKNNNILPSFFAQSRMVAHTQAQGSSLELRKR